MEIVFDHWYGEQLDTVIPSIAEFRKQVLEGHDDELVHSLSNEINYLKHYFDSEAIVVVANDCGAIVGYASLITSISSHENCQLFSYYGSDIRITEGPLVHSNYRGQQIGSGLVSELVSICQAKDIEILLCDPDALINPETLEIGQSIMKSFGFESLKSGKSTVYKRDIFM